MGKIKQIYHLLKQSKETGQVDQFVRKLGAKRQGKFQTVSLAGKELSV